MDPITLGLGVVGLLVLGFGIFKVIRTTKDLPQEARVAALLAYAPQAVAAAAQIFKLFAGTQGADKDDVNAKRKNYAMTLMMTLATQFKLPITEDMTNLISSAIEAAVNARK